MQAFPRPLFRISIFLLSHAPVFSSVRPFKIRFISHMSFTIFSPSLTLNIPVHICLQSSTTGPLLSRSDCFSLLVFSEFLPFTAIFAHILCSPTRCSSLRIPTRFLGFVRRLKNLESWNLSSKSCNSLKNRGFFHRNLEKSLNFESTGWFLDIKFLVY